jgi:hypothetical protein
MCPMVVRTFRRDVRTEYVLYVKPGIKGLANVRARHNGDGEGSPLRHSKE